MSTWRCISELRGDPLDPVHATAAALLHQPVPEKQIFAQYRKTTPSQQQQQQSSNQHPLPTISQPKDVVWH